MRLQLIVNDFILSMLTHKMKRECKFNLIYGLTTITLFPDSSKLFIDHKVLEIKYL